MRSFPLESKTNDCLTPKDLENQWKRVLYDKQALFKDNFYHSSKFFERLAFIRFEQKLTLSQNLAISFVSGQTISLLWILFGVYKLLVLDLMDLKLLFGIDTLLSILFWLWEYCGSKRELSAQLNSLRIVLIFVSCARIIAPLVRMLTYSFSDDTIYALSICFSVIHILFQKSTDGGGGTSSFSAAFFLSLILSSRLSNTDTIASFLYFSMSIFFFMPKLLQTNIFYYQISVSLILWAIASRILFYLDATLFWVYQVMIIILSIVGALLLSSFPQFKTNIRGPWDIATYKSLNYSLNG